MQGNNFVDEIKSRCNIVDVIGRVVQLKKAGSNYKGNCPFHNEKTPSFVVSEHKQIYTCFGCGATGDVIEFVQRYYSLDFMQAVEKLAGEYGIEIDTGFRENKKKDELYEINREAASFFYNAFTTSANPGYTYMRKRGIEPRTLKRFGIGYADEKWDSLYKYLKGKGYDEKTLLELGLISESKGKYYDKFRNRVMFPIINTRGKVIGFGGRAIGDDSPKYLNSPESSIFLKKNNLYGLNLTRQDIGKENCAILVEGYMDVISLYQAGVTNVSASLGTALTENQAALLKRYTDKVVLSYDADDAGRAAALRGLDILYRSGINVKVLHVTDGKDPDEFVKKKGKDAFIALTQKALPYADYKIEHIKRGLNLNDTEGRLEFIKQVIKVLKELTPSAADMYIRKIADEMKISEGAIRLELYGNNITGIQQKTETKRPEFTENAGNQEEIRKSGNKPIGFLEKNLIKLVLTDETYYRKVTPYTYIFKNFEAVSIWNAIKEVHKDGEEIHISSVREQLEQEARSVFDDIIDSVPVAGNEEKTYRECVRNIEILELTKRENEIKIQLAMADENEDTDGIRALTEEFMEIQKLKNAQEDLQ